MIAAISGGSLICNTLAVKFGKRPIYLLTSIGLFATNFWAAEAKSFGSLVAARTLGGFCMAPMEALVPASIADIWFVHERGYRTAIFNLGVLGGINLASPIGTFPSGGPGPLSTCSFFTKLYNSWCRYPVRIVANVFARHGRRLRRTIPRHILLDARVCFRQSRSHLHRYG